MSTNGTPQYQVATAAQIKAGYERWIGQIKWRCEFEIVQALADGTFLVRIPPKDYKYSEGKGW